MRALCLGAALLSLAGASWADASALQDLPVSARAPQCASRAASSVRVLPPLVRPASPVSIDVAVNCNEVHSAGAVASAPPGNSGQKAGDADRVLPSKEDRELQRQLLKEAAELRRQLLLGGGVGGAILGGLAILLALFAVQQAGSGRGMQCTSQWGGFGGAGSGWRLSGAGVHLVAAALLGALSMMLLTEVLSHAQAQVTAPTVKVEAAESKK